MHFVAEEYVITLQLLAYTVLYLELGIVWFFFYRVGQDRCLFQVHCLVLKIVLVPFSYIS